jgi:nucleotide-binding universal stress UspA family protein
MITASPATRIAVENILFPTDFSPQSEAAFEYAKLLARRYDATIHALHVFIPELYGALPAESLAAAVVTMRRHTQERMDDLHRRMQGLQHETCIAEAGLWDALRHSVEQHAIDIIVLGTTARVGMERLLLGSVAEEIFRRAEVPVLTVGPHARAAEEDVHFDKILFATDFSAAAEKAASYAIALAQEYQSQLSLLHVIPDHGEYRADFVRVTTVLSEKMRALLPEGAELWCEPELVVQCGAAADRILAVATERQANLIVLGAKKSEHPLAATHLRWPTAAHVVHDSTAPVLTVRG